MTSTWKNEFELPDGFGSLSDNQDYIEYIQLYIIRNHKKLTKIHAIHVCINGINNRLVLKDWYKLELQTSETMKLFHSTKNLREETKKWRICAKPWIRSSSLNPM